MCSERKTQDLRGSDLEHVITKFDSLGPIACFTSKRIRGIIQLSSAILSAVSSDQLCSVAAGGRE